MDITVYEKHHAILYDGTNGTAIAAALNFTVVSDNGSTLVLQIEPGYTVEISAGSWAHWRVFGEDINFDGVATDAVFSTRFAELDQPAAPALVTASGESEEIDGGGLGGQTQTVDIPIAPALEGTDWVPVATLRGAGTLLSGHGITAVEVLDEETVRVSIGSAPLAAAGASVHVVAHQLQA